MSGLWVSLQESHDNNHIESLSFSSTSWLTGAFFERPHLGSLSSLSSAKSAVRSVGELQNEFNIFNGRSE